MTSKFDPVEKRKYKRYKVEVGALTLLKANSDKELGRVMNISRGGLAYHYTPKPSHPVGRFIFDLFWVGNRRLLSEVPCKTIYDFTLAKKFPFSFKKIRVRGVQFDELSQGHASRLEYFIENYALGAVS